MLLVLCCVRRRRTIYRRPSALGVPDAKVEGNSEYLVNYQALEGGDRPTKMTGGRPEDHLVQEGTFDGTTMAKNTFKVGRYK